MFSMPRCWLLKPSFQLITRVLNGTTCALVNITLHKHDSRLPQAVDEMQLCVETAARAWCCAHSRVVILATPSEPWSD